MMKKIISIFLLVAATTISFAQTISSDDKQAINTLRTFYTAYVSEFSNENNAKKFEGRLDELRRKYYTVKCQKQYKRLGEETDSDPIIKGQDSDAKFAKTLSIKRDFGKSNVFDVSYYYLLGENGKTHKEIITIKLLVIKENGNFKIDKFL
jgi:hypothetical protein